MARAFTLIELLIVIGIVLLLMGLLIPLVGRMRITGQTVNTKQMISRLEAGINSYFSDFGSYPGPFLNGQLSPTQSTAPLIGNTVGAALNVGPITPAENLFLAMAGGLSYNGTTFSYNNASAQSPLGPGNLNAANMKRYSPYMAFTVDETSFPSGSNARQAGNVPGVWNVPNGTLLGDSAVPEFLDKYSRPSPILFIRALTGQDQLAQYPENTFEYNYAGPTQDDNAYWQPDATAFPTIKDSNGYVTLNQQFESYIGNPLLSTATSPVIRQQVPYKKDAYILISPGPDGKYGTADDVTNFR